MDYTNYRQIDKIVDGLFAKQQYAAAIELLHQAQKQFPQDLYEILWYKTVIYAQLQDQEKVLAGLETMLTHDFFADLSWSIFDPIRSDPRFKAVYEASQRLKAEAQKKAHMSYQLHTPQGYDPTKAYPLFLALHGDAEPLDYFKSRWEADTLLNQGFIVVYIQSSQVANSPSFGWTDDYATARKDVEACYAEVTQQYIIDLDQVLIGGFSGGSIAAIELCMAATLPLKGFVALCPSLKPDSFTPSHVAQAVQRGVRGVMLEGELEGEIPDQQSMITIFEKADFPYQFHINPGIGHAFPPNFSQHLLDAIAFIQSDSK